MTFIASQIYYIVILFFPPPVRSRFVQNKIEKHGAREERCPVPIIWFNGCSESHCWAIYPTQVARFITGRSPWADTKQKHNQL
jgi:hypothetical protein